MRTSLFLFTVLLVAPAARADCVDTIAELTPRVAAIPDQAKRHQAERALANARHELDDENDQPECLYFVAQARALLAKPPSYPAPHHPPHN